MQQEGSLPSCLFSSSRAVSNSLIYGGGGFPKGSGKNLQDEESQEKISGSSRTGGLCSGCIWAGTPVPSGRSCRGAENMPGSGLTDCSLIK